MISHKNEETPLKIKSLLNSVAVDHQARVSRRDSIKQGIDFDRYVSKLADFIYDAFEVN